MIRIYHKNMKRADAVAFEYLLMFMQATGSGVHWSILSKTWVPEDEYDVRYCVTHG